ncbi:Crp/Fnr family transcriptional regulator [Mesorhizobium sp. SARCC-RB16n]|uniref:Crp/Fnr family transcriptional regulator n=1 Tax=Mesorhizobium sp. SARCC-RB16n TaxID=2116687 RepID=UPI00122F1CE1|nr:Crp/Fnr family transcriptional regulator [Mesorhizobium sp. SARCC-RB16n]KAA3448002.1 Crp/Fnr family transcriptional regulator [Mesorhizobium sp. SARCC-RB16n]
MAEFDRSAAFWRSFPIFRDFDDKTIAALAGISSFRKWLPDTVIFQRGDEGNYMVGVISGRIKVSLITPQGRELILRQLEAGELFGEMAMLDDQPRSADATAQVASQGFVIPKRPFMDLIKLSPGAAKATIRYLCSRLRGITEHLETIALYHLNSRAARFLLVTLRQIHGNELPVRADLKLALTQSDIAGILGASRPKVNRAILALEEAGAIRRSNGIIECNTERLQWIAEPSEY